MCAAPVSAPRVPAAGLTAPPKRGLREAVIAFRHRNFTLFWTGALVSNIGTWMQNITVPFALLYVMHTGPAWVGVATVSLLLPGVLFGPLAGAIADRFPRRTVLIISQAIMGGLALGLWGVWVAGNRNPYVFVGIIALTGVANGLTMPSWQAFVTELVPRKDLLNAITLNSAQFNGSRAIGPAIAGLVLARLGPGAAFLLNGVSFLAVIFALLLVKVPAAPPRPPREPVMRQFAEAARYTRSNAGIMIAIVTVTLVALFGLPVSQMATVVAKQVFHLDAGQFGLLTAAYGAGAVLGALLLGILAGTIRRSRLVLGSVIGFAFAEAGFALAPNFLFGIVGLLGCGMAFLAAVASLNTSVQLIVPEALRGRVLALYMMAFTAAFPLGSLVQTTLAEVWSARVVLLVSAGLLFLSGGGLAIRPRWLAALEAEGEQPVEILAVEPLSAPPTPAEVAASTR
jgi:MFS family permease